MTNPDIVSIWTIYDHPSDDPEVYLARRFEIVADGAIATGDTLRALQLETIQQQLQEWGFVPVNRNELDDPVIVESWL